MLAEGGGADGDEDEKVAREGLKFMIFHSVLNVYSSRVPIE